MAKIKHRDRDAQGDGRSDHVRVASLLGAKGFVPAVPWRPPNAPAPPGHLFSARRRGRTTGRLNGLDSDRRYSLFVLVHLLILAERVTEPFGHLTRPLAAPM
jgi:hypothetical protein